MNTHDIELPRATHFLWDNQHKGTPVWKEQEVRNAIEADRQQRGEPLTHRCESCNTVFQGGGCPYCRLAAPVVKESLTAAEPVATQGEDELFYKLGCFIDHATGGRLSKLGWSLETLRQAHDENVQVIVDDALADERASRDADRGNVPDTFPEIMAYVKQQPDYWETRAETLQEILDGAIIITKEEIDNTIKVMKDAILANDVVLMSDPPQSAWKFHGIEGKLRKAIKELEGLTEDK